MPKPLDVIELRTVVAGWGTGTIATVPDLIANTRMSPEATTCIGSGR
jgi:hypothetical protein